MKVLFLSHSADTGTFKVGSHHLAREFAVAGHDVVHVSTPVSLLHLLKLRDPDVRARFALAFGRRRTDSYGVRHIVPLTLVPSGGRFARLAFCFNGAPRRALQSLQRTPDLVLIDQVHLRRFFRFEPKTKLVYRPTDAHFDPRTIEAERNLLKEVGGVIATSEVVLTHTLQLSSETLPSIVVENGVDLTRFSVGDECWDQRSGFIYVGALDSRFDWSFVARLAAAFPDERVRIIGPLVGDPLELPPNVEIVGPIPYESVAHELVTARIGLLPLTDHPGNEGRSPMKYFEYLACGLWVLASWSPSLAEREAPGVTLVRQLDDLESSAGRLLSLSHFENSLGVEYSSEYSWPRRAALMEDFVNARVTPRG